MPEGSEVKVPAVGRVNRKWLVAGGLAVAAAVIYVYWRSSQTPATVEGEELPSDEGTGLYAGGGVDAYSGAVGGQTYTPTEDQAPRTNAEWTQRAVDALSAIGYESQFAAEALGKWLAGQPLTATEALVVRVAKGLLGPPPAGDLPIIPVGTPPTNPPAPGPAAGHVYVTQLHAFPSATAVRDAVQRFSDPAVATPNNVQTAVKMTQSYPGNLNHIRNGVITAKHQVRLFVVKRKAA